MPMLSVNVEFTKVNPYLEQKTKKKCQCSQTKLNSLVNPYQKREMNKCEHSRPKTNAPKWILDENNTEMLSFLAKVVINLTNLYQE